MRGIQAINAYLVSLCGEYDRIESLRVPLTEFLKDQNYEHRYVISDEVSEYIACRLYPYLYRIENLLRGYLTKSMTTRIGPTWWQLTASTEMSNKAKIRKKNEVDFGRHVDNSAFLIDFDELGELVYEQSSGFLNRDDIVRRVNDLEESVEALKNLKQELGTNYQKYFREAFADRDFKSKWKSWEGLRNKIAHNNLFTNDDLTRGTALAEEIIGIITEKSARLVTERLKKSSDIEVYYVENPYSFGTTAALRSVADFTSVLREGGAAK